jgi:signal transduction histidine kinase/CheY-like chemotaxis protein/tetratricopeptide (TPR) repeat protein
MKRSWSEFRHRSDAIVDGPVRLVTAADDSGNRVQIHTIDYAAGLSTAVRLRLEYETAKYADLGAALTGAPLGFEFSENFGEIVCSAIEGVPLNEMLQQGPMPFYQATAFAEDLLEELILLHRAGIVRRWLCPGDITIQGRTAVKSAGGKAVIAAFAPLQMLMSLSNPAIASELAKYSSPESLGALEENVRPSSDLYSLGTLLFECLTGTPLFQTSASGDIVFQHMTCPVPRLTEIRPEIPQSLEEIVRRLLQKQPRDRYQSAAGVLHDLKQFRAAGGTPHRLILGTCDQRDSLIEPAFVGRTAELDSIESELKLIQIGKSRTVIVSGASGLGKSRLFLEVARTAAGRGFRILRASGKNQAGLAPLSSLHEALKQCLLMIGEDAALQLVLRSALSEHAQELGAINPEIVSALGLSAAGSPDHVLTDRRIAMTLAILLGAMGSERQPILLVLDDMQWADDLTLLMLESWHLTNSRWTGLLIGTRPSEGVAQRLLQGLLCSIRIGLEPLTRQDHDQLLISMAGSLPEPALASIWRMSEGNPFVASAVVRGVVESGIMTPSAEGWRLDEARLRHLQMSGEAVEILKQRLLRLSDESRELLAVGAVLGKEFRLEMTAHVAGIPLNRVLSLLSEPRQNCLVWENRISGMYEFFHDQIRDAVLKCVPEERSKSIHLRAADYLCEVEPDRIFDIACHFDAAGEFRRAGGYAIQAAQRAHRAHALEIAEQQFRIALRSCENRSMSTDFQILYGLGDVLMLSGRYREAEPLFEQAIQCADSVFNRAEVTLKLGELAFKEDRKDRAIELWESALVSLGGKKITPSWRLPLSVVREIGVQCLHTLFPRLLVGRRSGEPSASDRLIWRLHSRLAYAYWYVRGKVRVLHSHLRGMNLAEHYAPTPELAQAYSEHAPAMSLIPLSRRGIAYGRRSLQIRTAQNDIWGQGQSLHCLAIALYSAAQYEECVDVGRRSVRILERAGDYWEKHTAQYQIAASLYRMGRFREAVKVARETYESGLTVGDFQVCGNILEVWARATDGDLPPEVLMAELERPRADVQGQAQVLLARGVCLLREEQFERAIEAFDTGIRVAREAGISNTYTVPLFSWKATALRTQLECRPPILRSRRRAIIKAHRKTSRQAVLLSLRFRTELPHALREYAWAQIFRNRNHRAQWLLRRSLRIARDQRAEYEAIQSDLLLRRICVDHRGDKQSESTLEIAQQRLTTFRTEQLPQQSLESLSIADRFDFLLESGRRIASGTDISQIRQILSDAARRLLRSPHAEVLSTTDSEGPHSDVPDSCWSLVEQAIQCGEALSESVASAEWRSLLVCPVIVRGRTPLYLVVGHQEIRNLYGPNELRIARYLTTIAGAALENAEGFRSLQDLNANLERIVQERTSALEARATELRATADSLRSTQHELAAARDTAEQASKAKSEFLARMSHEIRTPIGAVLGFTELLLKGDAPLTTEQRSFLQRVLSNGNHLHRLLNDLLDLSRIEARELTIETIEVAPYRLLFDVLSALQSKAIDKNLRLSLRVANQIPESIRTDPTRLRQILTNLIGNAIKFTSVGSVNLLVDTDPSAGQLKIHVQDTGPGIPCSAQQDVFEPFRQADPSIVRKYGGTGLGLPISRHLAQALGGEIELVSEPGLGSTFTVTIATGDLSHTRLLSASEAEMSLSLPDHSRRIHAKLDGIRILIVDDVDANRDLFGLVLRRAGAECVLAEDGQQAVQLVAKQSFDLILMDMQMPVMDGYTATRTLRSMGVAIPVLAITANGMDKDQLQCLTAGCTGYLTKPIATDGLLRAVSEQLGRDVEESALPGTVVLSSASGGIPEDKEMTASGFAEKQPLPEMPEDPVFREFAVRFLRKVEAAIPRIQSSIQSCDDRRLRELAHWIRGTGGTVGLMSFSDLGAELGTFARAGDFLRAEAVACQLESLTRSLLFIEQTTA